MSGIPGRSWHWGRCGAVLSVEPENKRLFCAGSCSGCGEHQQRLSKFGDLDLCQKCCLEMNVPYAEVGPSKASEGDPRGSLVPTHGPSLLCRAHQLRAWHVGVSTRAGPCGASSCRRGSARFCQPASTQTDWPGGTNEAVSVLVAPVQAWMCQQCMRTQCSALDPGNPLHSTLLTRPPEQRRAPKRQPQPQQEEDLGSGAAGTALAKRPRTAGPPSASSTGALQKGRPGAVRQQQQQEEVLPESQRLLKLHMLWEANQRVLQQQQQPRQAAFALPVDVAQSAQPATSLLDRAAAAGAGGSSGALEQPPLEGPMLPSARVGARAALEPLRVAPGAAPSSTGIARAPVADELRPEAAAAAAADRPAGLAAAAAAAASTSALPSAGGITGSAARCVDCGGHAGLTGEACWSCQDHRRVFGIPKPRSIQVSWHWPVRLGPSSQTIQQQISAGRDRYDPPLGTRVSFAASPPILGELLSRPKDLPPMSGALLCACWTCAPSCP